MKRLKPYKSLHKFERYRSFTLLVCFVIISFSINAQKIFQSLEDKASFPFGKVYQIKTGLNGMIWISTDGGIIRYNSQEFFKYSRGSGLPKDTENAIYPLIVDKTGDIWAASKSHLLNYNYKTDEFDTVTRTSFNIKAITEDGNGNIWLSANSGLYKFDNVKKELELFESGNVEYIRGINDLIYYYINGILYTIDCNTLKQKEIAAYPTSVNSMYSHNNSTFMGFYDGSVYESKNNEKPIKILNFNGPVVDIDFNNGHYYFASDLTGIYKYDSNFNLIEKYTDNQEQSIWYSGPSLFDLEFDNENILWLALFNYGLDYLDPFYLNVQNLKHIKNDANSLRDNFTRVIQEDEQSRIWFGTKIGLCIFEPENNSWIQFPNFNEFVLDIEPIDDYMLLSTYKGGLFKISKNDLKIKKLEETNLPKDAFDYVFKIERLKNGDLIFGRLEQPLLIKTKTGEYHSDFEFDAVSIEQSGESIYLGSTNQVYKLNLSNYKATPVNSLSSSNYLYSRINSISTLTNNKLLFATTGAGILLYNKQTDSVIQISTNDGLLTDNILNVNAINETTLLAATDYGLSKIDLKGKGFIITNFTKKDGFVNNFYQEKAFSKLHDGRFAYGGTEGVSIFNPNVLLSKKEIPPIFFESIKSGNDSFLVDRKLGLDPLTKPEKIILSPGNHSILFEFTTIQHRLPELITYSYKLEGIDEEWSRPVKIGKADYQIQNSGNYTFQVRASTDGINWVNERSINLRIKPFWWQSNFAYILYFLCFCALISTYYFVNKQVEEKKNVENQLEFFSNMIHEVKTPLAILISSLSREEKKKEKVSVKKLRGTIDRLSSLFEQMLNFQSVLHKDTNLVRIDEIEIERYIQDVIHDFHPMLEEKNLSIEIDNKKNDSKFYFYKNGLSKIFYNLISNAIKYSTSGGSILLTLEQASDGQLKFAIKDSGVGIPENQQSHIFKRFYRAKNVQNSNFSGSGLGLLIVKSVVDKTGGSIWFESIENVGTTFFVELNSFAQEYKQNIEELKETAALSEEPQYKDQKILFIEDNDELRAELCKSLSIDFKVIEARNGKEGFEKINKELPDIIITDLIMPEMDGLELAKKVKENIEYSHIPIIMMSVLRDKDQVHKSMEHGIVEFLYKPVDPDLLIARIVSLLKWQSNLKNKYLTDSDIGEAFDSRNEAAQKYIEQLENFVVKNVLKNITVSDLSEEIGMSRTSLYNKLKQLIDLSPQDFIIHTKLKLAKKELRNTDKSIKEVAFETGFFDQSHLSKTFKKSFGKSPTAYRKEFQKKLDKLN